MKHITLGLFLLLTISAIGQNCKFEKNEIDKFTGKFTKITKAEKVIGTFFTSGEFSVKRIDTSFFFTFDYVLSSYSKFEPYSISEGAQLIFLFENGETVTLKSVDNIQGTKKTTVGIPPVYSCYLTNVSYTISKNDIETFFKSKVKSIRFYRNESNGKEDYIDNDIKKKNQDDIQSLVKCLL